MRRAIVNVATGEHYLKGQQRLVGAFKGQQLVYFDEIPPDSPLHEERPYAFKAYALHGFAENFDAMLWCDACIIPGPRPLSDLWEYIEENGVWFAKNGYPNYEWTADSAYPDLFGREIDSEAFLVAWNGESPVDAAAILLARLRAMNRAIPHVVATAFGISLKHPKGKAFLDEYFRLASETKAFCGPWINANHSPERADGPSIVQTPRIDKCGPADVCGHRHDQTAASVIAWRLGIPLTECPEWFAYKGGETEKTCLIADGAY